MTANKKNTVVKTLSKGNSLGRKVKVPQITKEFVGEHFPSMENEKGCRLRVIPYSNKALTTARFGGQVQLENAHKINFTFDSKNFEARFSIAENFQLRTPKGKKLFTDPDMFDVTLLDRVEIRFPVNKNGITELILIGSAFYEGMTVTVAFDFHYEFTLDYGDEITYTGIIID